MPRSRLALAGILLLYIGLSSLYFRSAPHFEGPDAYYHFAVIQHIDNTGELPPKDEYSEDTTWQQMTFHAPLYYMLSATIIDPLDTSEFANKYPRNPHAAIGDTSMADNENFVAYVDYPLEDTELAIVIIRIFSIVLGLLTLIASYALLRNIFQSQPRAALLGTLFVTIIPQYIFLSTMISNDNLVILLTTTCLALLTWMIRTEVTYLKLMIIAITAATASLAKASGMAIYPIIALGILWIGYRDKWQAQRWILYTIIGLGSWLIIAGWWYWGNFQELGNPFATSQIAFATEERTTDIDYIDELRGLYYSYWGLFGWFNILAPQWFYNFINIFIVGIGAIWLWKRPRFKSQNDIAIAGLLAVFVITVLVAWFQFFQMVEAGQGRLWYPFLAIIAALVGGALSRLPRSIYGVVILVPLLFSTIWFPFNVINPAYESDGQLAENLWIPPEDAVPVHLFEPWQDQDNACLTMWISPPKVEKEHVIFTMETQTHCSLTGFWSYFIHIVDLEQENCVAGDTAYILYQQDTMPHGGDLSLPAFKPNHIQRDVYRIPLENINQPLETLHIQTGFYDANGTFIRMLIADESIPSDDVFIGKCGSDTITIPFMSNTP